MDYSEGDTIPPGYRTEKRMRKGLFIAGAVTFGSSYLVSVFVAAIASDSKLGDALVPLYAPLAGPFITIATAESEGAATFTLVLDGVAQTGGLALALAGLLWKENILVRSDIPTSFMVTPMVVGRGTMGLGIVGSM
jgi:hypothetical protein